jgi:hypothetical protein
MGIEQPLQQEIIETKRMSDYRKDASTHKRDFKKRIE